MLRSLRDIKKVDYNKLHKQGLSSTPKISMTDNKSILDESIASLKQELETLSKEEEIVKLKLAIGAKKDEVRSLHTHASSSPPPQIQPLNRVDPQILSKDQGLNAALDLLKGSHLVLLKWHGLLLLEDYSIKLA